MPGGVSRVAVIVIAAVTLSSCNTVKLRNPRIGDVATCESMRYSVVRDCVADFQRQGYERMP